MLDLRRLRVFQEVARRRSFSRAALELSYSQSVVSHHIARLELEVGMALLERGGPDGVSATPAGTALLAHVDRILRAVADAEAELGALAGAREGEIRVATFATAAATIVAEAVAVLRAGSTPLDVDVVEAERDEALDHLRDGRVDIALAFDDDEHLLPLRDDLERLHLLEDPLLLALPATHQLCAVEPLTLARLRGERWIAGGGAASPNSLMLRSACVRAGFEPRIIVGSGNAWTAQGLVAAGVGVALLPALGLQHRRPGIAIRALEDVRPARKVAAFTRTAPRPASAIQRFLSLLTQTARRHDVAPGLHLPRA